MNLVKNKAKIYYDAIIKYVQRIECVSGPDSYIFMYSCDSPTYMYIGSLSQNDDDNFCFVGGLVHEAYHIKQCKDYTIEHQIDPLQVPYDVYGNRQGETRCLLAEYDVLKQIGAPQEDLDWVYREVIDSEWWEE